MHLGGDGRDGLQQARIRLNCFAITDALNDTAIQSPRAKKVPSLAKEWWKHASPIFLVCQKKFWNRRIYFGVHLKKNLICFI